LLRQSVFGRLAGYEDVKTPIIHAGSGGIWRIPAKHPTSFGVKNVLTASIIASGAPDDFGEARLDSDRPVA